MLNKLLFFCLALSIPRPSFFRPLYRNIFREAGYRQTDIDARLNNTYRDLFEGPRKIYFEVGDSMGYVSDLKNHIMRADRRTLLWNDDRGTTG